MLPGWRGNTLPVQGENIEVPPLNSWKKLPSWGRVLALQFLKAWVQRKSFWVDLAGPF